MTNTNTQPVTITVLASGLTIPAHDDGKYSFGRVAYRGEVVTFTPEQVAETADRTGFSWLDMTEEEQISRWSEVKFARGDQSEGIELGDDDVNGLMYRKWQRDVQNAEKISDPGERAAEFKKIKAKYPAQYGSTQRTLREY